MRFLILATFLLCTVVICGQQIVAVNPLVLSSVSEENGLSDNHTQCVLKDKTGQVWIGTGDGLNLMNGSSIKIFRHNAADTQTIVNNNILSLAEDKNGDIWVGTTDGLSCYQQSPHRFISFTPPQSVYGAAGMIKAIVIEDQSHIWCCTDGGLMLLNPATKKFTPFLINSITNNNPMAFNRLNHMIMDSRRKLWICTDDGLWSFDLKNHQFKMEIHSRNNIKNTDLFIRVFEDHLGGIWASCWDNGLKKIDRITGKIISYIDSPGCPGVIRTIIELHQPGGKYVLWLDGNLLAFDPGTNRFFHFDSPLESTPYPFLCPYFQSADGWIWLTSDKGLFIYSPLRQGFRHYFFDASFPITSQSIVFAEWQQQLLIGAEGNNFLKAYDENWKMTKDLQVLNSNPLPSGKQGAALTLIQKNNARFWMATSKGIVSLNPFTGSAKWFVHKDKDSLNLPRNFITSIFFDSQNQLWIFPWRMGIWTMDTLTGRCKQVWKGFISKSAIVKGMLIADAIEDSLGNIWMCDMDEGIILFDRSTQTFSKPFRKELGEQYYAGRIFLRNGVLYANSYYNILKWSPLTRKLQLFTPPVEMYKEIYDMMPDRNGNWWLTTKNGLVVFNEANHSFKRYTTNDGLTNNNLSGMLYCRRDGTMLIGMPNYITLFDPVALTSTTSRAERLLLTDLQINEKNINWDSTQTLELDYRSTNIVFKWALPDYINPFKNRYYCQLEGIDADWKYLGNKGEIQYANLSPGHYRIFLKAATANGTAAANIISIPFIIYPPYWKTTWFILACIAAFLTLLIFSVRYISRCNLKEKLLRLEKEQAVEKERNRISRDMHDDLGSGLTKIAIMSEVIKKQLHEPEKAKLQLENISSSSRELVDNLQDIVWILNPKNDTLENLASYIREYGIKFFEPFDIVIRFNYPEKFTDIKLLEETRRNIFLAVKESFTNIAKHAWCNNVKVTISGTASSIDIQIEDDGKGFDEAEVRLFGNGLLNMKNRIEQVKGHYRLTTRPGKGAIVWIEVPV